MGTSEAAIETAEKRGYRTPARGRAPVRPEPARAGLCRQFRADGIRHRRDLRLPGARPARPRFRPQIRPAGDPGGAAAGRRPGDLRDRRRGLCRRRHDLFNSGFLDGLVVADAKRARRRAARSSSAAASARSPTACATGACRASATGAARSRSSIAPTAASCRCRSDDLPVELPEDVTLRPARATRSTTIRPGSTSPARAAAGRRGARPTRSTPSSNRPGISCASARPRAPVAVRPRGGRLLDAGRPVYRRRRARDAAPALFALLHPRAEAVRLSRPRRAVRRPVHPGHGLPPDLPERRRANGCSPRKSTARPAGSSIDAAGRPVTVGRSEKMSKSKKNVVDLDAIVDTYGADTARLICCPTARPSATSNGPRPASRASGATSTGCGGMASEPAARAAAAPAVADAGRLPPALDAIRRAHPQDDRRGHRRSRQVPLQPRGRADPRADQCARRAPGGRAPAPAAVLREGLETAGPAARPDDAASRRGDVADARPCASLLADSPGRRPTRELTRDEQVTIAVQVNGKLRGTLDLAARQRRPAVESAALALPQVAALARGPAAAQGHRRAEPHRQHRRVKCPDPLPAARGEGVQPLLPPPPAGRGPG